MRLGAFLSSVTNLILLQGPRGTSFGISPDDAMVISLLLLLLSIFSLEILLIPGNEQLVHGLARYFGLLH